MAEDPWEVGLPINLNVQKEQICREKLEFSLGPGKSERLTRAPCRDGE